MVTGELKNKIDSLWLIFFTGGLTNPLEVIEQMTYLMFIHDLDDVDNTRAREAAMLGLPYKSLFAKEVEIGGRVIDGSQLKWSVFHDFPAGKMYSTVQEWVFPFIKELHGNKESAYSKYMGGRCACIVPDGVLFGSSTAHKAIRKELIEGNRLEAVISMPSGVFKPYAGVSTAVLIFTKTGHGGTDKVWFYDMKADGFSLDDKRTPLEESDIPDIVARFRNLEAEQERKRTDQSFFVPKDEIVNNGYDLSINKYKKTEYVPVQYPPTGEILDELDRLQAEITTGLAELRGML